MKLAYLAVPTACVLALACSAPRAQVGDERADDARRWFRAVYSGDVSTVEELAAEDVVLSYPLFEDVLGSPVVRGRADVLRFVARFAGRWTEPRTTFDDTVAQGDRVVLVWSFRARPAQPAGDPDAEAAEIAWGGITLVRFDQRGRVVAEIGEESTPGPAARVAGPR